jgi:hypothetical protein
MPQGKLKVKTKLPAKTKSKKKAKGPAFSKRGSKYNLTSINVKFDYFTEQDLFQVFSICVEIKCLNGTCP